MRINTAHSTLQETLVEDIQKLLSLEKAFMMALPMMAENATNVELQREFERMTHQTRDQIARLQNIVSPCPLEALPPAHDEYSRRDIAEPPVLDCMLIAETRQKQHAKIALYSTVCVWAHQLGLREMERLLALNLREEEENSEKLLRMAQNIHCPTA